MARWPAGRSRRLHTRHCAANSEAVLPIQAGLAGAGLAIFHKGEKVMSNAKKVSEFLEKAKVFYFLTTDGEQPKGRPFGFHLLEGDRIYFGTGTFKNVYRQLTENPKVEVLAMAGEEFMRYDGTAKVVKDDALLAKVRAAAPDIMSMYDANGWEMGLFYLEGGHAEIRGMMDQKEEFDV